MKKELFIFFLFSFLLTKAQIEPVSLPYSNSFETEDDRNYWYNFNTGSGNPWEFTTEFGEVFGPSDGTTYARFHSSYQYDGTAWLISKSITLEAGQNIVLEFDYRSSLSYLFPQKMEVLLKPYPAPGTDNSVLLWRNEFIQLGSYNNVYQTFQVAETGTYHLIFHAYSEPNYGYLSLDNINLYVEQCPKPLNVSTHPRQTMAEIFWETTSAPEEGFEIVVQSAGLGIPTGNGEFVSTPYFTKENLSPETEYEVYIRSVCETGSVYSDWSVPVRFRTYPISTAMPVNLPYNESFERDSRWLILQSEIGATWQRGSINDFFLTAPSDGEYYMMHYDNSNEADAWIFSRGINLPAGVEIILEFDYRSSQDFYYPEKMEVVLSKDSYPSVNSVQLWKNEFIQSTTYETASVRFTVPEDGVYYLGYHAYSEADFGYLMFDNVKVFVDGISPCEYVLKLKDERGDGWGNNSMDLIVNGDIVFDDIRLPMGDSMDFSFKVSPGDVITAIWNGGDSHGWETSYEIYDSFGNLVASASQEDISEPIIAFCPSCAKPTNLVVNYGQTTVDLTWDFFTEPMDGYEYVVQPMANSEPTSGTRVQGQYVHVDGLMPMRYYEVYVRSVCEDGVEYSSWAGPVYFRTLPNPGEPVELPYHYSFEEPDGWISQSISRNNTWIISDIDPADGQYHLLQDYNYYFNANSWVFSRGLKMNAQQEVLIKFKYRAMGVDVPLSMSISNQAYAFAHDNVLWSETISNTQYRQAIITFTPEETGVYYLGFHSLAPRTMSVAIDQVEVYVVGIPNPPICEYNCPEDITVLSNPGDIGAVVNYNLFYECEDSSNGVFSVLTEGLPSGAIFPVGTTTVTHNLIYNGEIIATCTFKVTVEENLSAGDLDKSEFSYYPNPVKDKLMINMDSEITQVSVYNLSGELLKSENWNRSSGYLDMKELPSGVYIINAKSISNVKSFKIVKN